MPTVYAFQQDHRHQIPSHPLIYPACIAQKVSAKEIRNTPAAKAAIAGPTSPMRQIGGKRSKGEADKKERQEQDAEDKKIAAMGAEEKALYLAEKQEKAEHNEKQKKMLKRQMKQFSKRDNRSQRGRGFGGRGLVAWHGLGDPCSQLTECLEHLLFGCGRHG